MQEVGKTVKDIEDRLISIVASKFDNENVSSKSHFTEDLGADSLDVVEMVMAVEEEFGIEVPDSEAEKIQNIEQMAQHVHKVIEESIKKDSPISSD